MMDTATKNRLFDNDVLNDRLAGTTPEERVGMLGSMLNGTPDSAASGTAKPSETAPNGGRDQRTGKFTRGNRFGKGNPFTVKRARLYSALAEAIDEDELKAVARKLLEMAKAGNLPA